MNGGQAVCVAFSGGASESNIVVAGVGTTAYPDPFSKTASQTGVVMAAYDMGTTNDLISAAVSGFPVVQTYLFADGALVGRGAFVGIDNSVATTTSASYPAAPALGYYFVRFDVN